MPTLEQIREAIAFGQNAVRAIASNFGPPVRWSDAEVAQYEQRMAELMTHPGEFALTVETKLCDYSFRHGVRRALGWDDGIKMAEFLELIHPDYFMMFQRWAAAAYTTTQQFKTDGTPLGQSYRIMLPIRNKRGDYFQVIQSSSMLQVDKDGNMLKYFSRYYVSHRAMDYAPLRPDIFQEELVNEAWTSAMNMEVAKAIAKHLFSGAEEKLLRAYHRAVLNMGDSVQAADWKPPALEDVAVALKTNVENLRKQRSAILRKAGDHMGRDFERIEHVYKELRRIGLFEIGTE
ncbi:MAG: hypothetical protein IPL52_01610 [Flavobacteriales bacterium]|nr:hypothetical protein [Flavobacteriales bacterium]